uniref:Uncharacterized protein n=1 Tax=Oryza punctata TaxID=4537 RepID=A0A0E0JZ96_ORYPU
MGWGGSPTLFLYSNNVEESPTRQRRRIGDCEGPRDGGRGGGVCRPLRASSRRRHLGPGEGEPRMAVVGGDLREKMASGGLPRNCARRLAPHEEGEERERGVERERIKR